MSIQERGVDQGGFSQGSGEPKDGAPRVVVASTTWPSASDPVEMTAGAPLYRYMPALDGLRGVAILWVLAAHLPPSASPVVAFCARRGPLGVELFFAMSGLLVTRSLHQCAVRAGSSRPADTLLDFFTRRVARIWPPYYFVLCLAIAAMLAEAKGRAHFGETSSTLWTFPLFIANLYFPHHPPPFSLLVMWSLCFEEQFYVVLMMLYALGGRQVHKWLLGGILFSISARLFGALLRPEWFEPFVMDRELQWRFDALAWACLVWIWHRPVMELLSRIRYRGAVQTILVLCVIAVCIPDPSTPAPRAVAYLALSPVFAALVAAVAFSPQFWLAKVLAWRPLVFLGVISYELYLLHYIVYRTVSRIELGSLAVAHEAIGLVASIVVAWGFHKFFSKPTQRVIRDWSSRAFGPRGRFTQAVSERNVAS